MAVIVLAAFFASGGLKAGHAVGDRLDAGQGDRATGEGLEKQEDAEPLGAEGRRRLRATAGQSRSRCRPRPPRPSQGQADEEVGRDGEDVAGLAQAAEVRDRDQRDGDEGDLDADCRRRRARPTGSARSPAAVETATVIT